MRYLFIVLLSAFNVAEFFLGRSFSGKAVSEMASFVSIGMLDFTDSILVRPLDEFLLHYCFSFCCYRGNKNAMRKAVTRTWPRRVKKRSSARSRIQYSNKYERFGRQMKWTARGRWPRSSGVLCDERSQAWPARIRSQANGSLWQRRRR